MKTPKGPKTETGAETYLRRLLETRERVRSVATFEEAGVLTMNRGLVVRFANGEEFQITIVQSTPRW